MRRRAVSEMRIHMFCYLWDLVDEGVDEVLDRLHGEAGMTGISVTTQYHRVDQLRPHLPGRSARFRSEGGAQFQFARDDYVSTRMRPVAAEWLGKSNPLSRVAAACRARKMSLRAWHVSCHNPATVTRYPEHAVKDVFGERHPDWLCPADLEVREWLRCQVEDLTRHYPFEAVELESACFPTRWMVGPSWKAGLRLGEVDRWLLSLCFCESCRQLAARDGLDVMGVVDSVRRHLEALFETGRPTSGPIDAFVAERPDLSAFVDWRCRQVTGLIELLRRACPVRLVVYRVGDRFWGGNDFAALASHCDVLMPLFYEADPEAMAECVARARREAGAADRVALAISACEPACQTAAMLVAGMKRAAELGIRVVNVYNYGLMPLARIDWLNHASRYARREAV